MGKRCFVPRCTSGYKSNTEKVSIFSPPKDETLLAQWIKNIPRDDKTLSHSDGVCAKHFEEKFIITEWKNDAVSIPFKKPRLADDAVPTKFPGCPSYLSKKVARERRPINRNACEKMERSRNVGKFSTSDDIPTGDGSSLTLNADEVVAVNFFENLWQSPFIKVPDEMWSVHRVRRNKLRLISVSRLYISEDSGIPLIQKQVMIYDDFKIDIFVRGQRIVNNIFPSNISASDGNIPFEIEKIVELLHNSKLCSGGPNFELYNPAITNCESASPDNHNQVWRHNRCTTILSQIGATTGLQNSCSFCSVLKDTLRINKTRKMKGRKSLRVRSSKLRGRDTEILKHFRKTRNQNRKTALRYKSTNEFLRKRIKLILNKLKMVDESNILSKLSEFNIPESQQMVVKECIRISKYSSKNSRRYTNDWLIVCLLLHIRSPAAYRLLIHNNILPLPSESTIRRYVGMMNMSCGMDDSFLQAFKIKLREKEIHQRRGALVFDEMQVRKSIKVDAKTMKLQGIVDLGEQHDNSNSAREMADHALVFMFCPFAESYSQPVAVYAAKGATKGTVLACLIIKIICKLETAGAKIDAIICDGASTNRRMWKEFGINGTLGTVQNKCVHPADKNRQLYFFSDTPHLYKCIRNRIYGKGFIKVPEGVVAWRHYEAVYKQDAKQPGDLKVCKKITYNHIYPSPMLKMRVKLATQVFSNAMVEGLIFYKNRGVSELTNANATVLITKKFNDTFDALNRKVPKEGIKQGSSDFMVLEDFLKWLDSWENEVHKGNISRDEFLSNSTAEGLRVTITSTMELCRFLLRECNFKYVLTAKINQDRLEQFFGIMRQAGGCNEHPSFATFLQLYRMLSIYKLIKPPRFGNCTVVDDSNDKLCLDNLKIIFEKKRSCSQEFIQNIKSKLEAAMNSDDDTDMDQLIMEDEASSISDCVLYYMAGFVCRKLQRATSCMTCKGALTVDSAFVNHTVAELTNQKSGGFLTHPSLAMFKIFKETESIFLSCVNSSTLYEDVITEVFNKVHLTFPCKIHKNDILAHALHYFVSRRMIQYFKNQDIKSKSASKETRKLSKLESL